MGDCAYVAKEYGLQPVGKKKERKKKGSGSLIYITKGRWQAHFIEFISLKADEVRFMSFVEGQVTDCSTHSVFLSNKAFHEDGTVGMVSVTHSLFL